VCCYREGSTAIGSGTLAGGIHSAAIGGGTYACGFRSTAMGGDTIAEGEHTTAMGRGTIARSVAETVLGSFNTDYTPVSGFVWNPADRLFVIGNGANAGAPSNALTMLKRGFIGFGSVTNPVFQLDLPNVASTAGQGRANAWNTYSDGRLKSHQEELRYGLAEILRRRPKTYTLNGRLDGNADGLSGDPGVRQIGFVAQEVREVVPEAVHAPANEATDLWSMDYQKLIPVLTRAIQELDLKSERQTKERDARIAALEERVDADAKIAALENQNALLLSRLAQLEAKLDLLVRSE
jgi:hypothetical protein